MTSKQEMSTFLLCITVLTGSCMFYVDGHLASVIKRQAGHPTTSAPAFPHPTTSVIYSCGAMYNSSLDLLFPLSRSSFNRIDNVTMAEIVSQQSIALFCSNHSVYAQCVKAGLEAPTTAIDRVVKRLINVDAFPAMVDQYCQQKDAIADKFMCTYEAIKSAGFQCGVGMEDLMMRVNELYTQRYTDVGIHRQTCRSIASDFKCTWRLIGEKCGHSYSNQMLFIYKGIVDPECWNYDGRVTDLLPCVANYIRGMQTRVTDAFSRRTPPSTTDIIAFVSREADVVCEVYEPMGRCVIDVIDKSTKRIDLRIKTLVDYKRLLETISFGCSMVPEIRKNTICAIDNIKAMIGPSPAPCVQDVIEKFGSLGQFIPGPNEGGFKETICSGLETALACFKPPIAACSTQLVEDVEEFVWRISTCRDPTSSASSVKVAMETMALLLTVRGLIL